MRTIGGSFLRQYDAVEVDVAFRAFEVAKLEAYHFYLLHQLLVVGIQRIEDIHGVVGLSVCG